MQALPKVVNPFCCLRPVSWMGQSWRALMKPPSAIEPTHSLKIYCPTAIVPYSIRYHTKYKMCKIASVLKKFGVPTVAQW